MFTSLPKPHAPTYRLGEYVPQSLRPSRATREIAADLLPPRPIPRRVKYTGSPRVIAPDLAAYRALHNQ